MAAYYYHTERLKFIIHLKTSLEKKELIQGKENRKPKRGFGATPSLNLTNNFPYLGLYSKYKQETR
jgi:hypothetical protein